MYRADASQVATFAPDGVSDFRMLGHEGVFGGLKHSFTMPGGADTLTGVLLRPATARKQAVEEGRVLRVYRGGGMPLWEGILTEPAPADDGWEITAQGAGAYGSLFEAEYLTWSADSPVDRAISRGLRWINSGLAAATPYIGQPTDSATITVTDHLNNISTPAGLTWYVNTGPRGNVLSMFNLPTTPTRLLIATAPVIRTLNGYYTTIWARYQATADSATGGAAATYGATSVSNAVNLVKHGPRETSFDLSPAGVMSAGTAQGVVTGQLLKYQAASYGASFTIRPGQLLNLGMQPVDLGSEEAGTCVQLLLAAGGYGGEVTPVIPARFVIGGYEYDDPTGTAQVTPFGAVRYDLSALVANWLTLHPAAA